MNFTSIGDLSLALQLRQSGATLRGHLAQLTEEVASGVKQDLGAAVSGDFAGLAGIDRSLRTLAAHAQAGAEAATLTAGLQTALDALGQLIDGAGVALADAATRANPSEIDTLAGDARQTLAGVVSALNVQIAGRYPLSGVAGDRRPVASADQILASLLTATAGLVDPDSIATAVDDWFAAPAGGGGFLDTAWNGATDPVAQFPVGEGETAELPLTAADPRIRDLLSGLALAALLDEGVLAGDATGRAAIARDAGAHIIASTADLAGMQGEVGVIEAQIDAARTRGQTQSAALDLARTGIVAADPYDSASALQAVENQIEALYTVTARIGQLSLADYL